MKSMPKEKVVQINMYRSSKIWSAALESLVIFERARELHTPKSFVQRWGPNESGVRKGRTIGNEYLQ